MALFMLSLEFTPVCILSLPSSLPATPSLSVRAEDETVGHPKATCQPLGPRKHQHMHLPGLFCTETAEKRERGELTDI